MSRKNQIADEELIRSISEDMGLGFRVMGMSTCPRAPMLFLLGSVRVFW